MDKFIKIKDIIKSLDDNSVKIITNELVKINPNTKTNLLKITNKKFVDNLLEIKKMDYKTKQNELKQFVLANPNIKLNFVEDWKDINKIKLTKFLIALEYMDMFSLMNWVGNESKKTYSNGEKINDNSLALRKFFDEEFKRKDSEFYANLMLFTDKLVEKGNDKELINNTNHELIQMIQAEIICRDKLNNGEYENYKKKITDIVSTRWLEEEIYMLFYQVRFQHLLADPKNYPLNFLVSNGWGETYEKYLWLVKLITFLNNGSLDAKNHLISYGVNDFSDSKNLVHNVASIAKLNMNSINEICNFIFNIKNYYKHKTYYKWYLKEEKKMNVFEKYKYQSLEKNITDQINLLTLNLEDLTEYKKIINCYHQLILKL